MTDTEATNIEELSQFAIDALRQAGDSALKYYGKGDSRLRFDDELVTEAELHIAGVFRDLLQSKFPGHRIFGDSESGGEYVHGQKSYMWTLDGPEGVANFQAGIPIWGVSLSLTENLWPVFGAFYMPSTGDFFHARAGGKAYWGNEVIRVLSEGEINNESLLLTYSRFQGRYHSDFPGKIRNMGCNAAHICYVAKGRAEGALLANVSYEDIVAAKIILEAAGGEIHTLEGKELQLNDYIEGQKIEEHLLAAAKDAHDQIGVHLQEIG